MKKTGKIIIGLAALALVAAVVYPRVMEGIRTRNMASVEGEKKVAVETVLVEQGSIATTVELIGTIAADKTVNVIPTIPAKVSKLQVKVGDEVEAGDPLFSLYTDDLDTQITQAGIGISSAAASREQAQVALKNAQASVESARLAYELALSNYRMGVEKYENGQANLARYRTLYEEGIISKADLEQMELNASTETLVLLEKQLAQAEQGMKQANIAVENAQATIKQADAGYRQATTSYSSAQDNRGDMFFTAPIRGFVVSVGIEEEQLATNAQPAVVLADIDKVVIRTEVSESLVNKVAQGQQVQIRIASLEGEEIFGTVTTINPVADSRTLLFPVTIEILNQDHKVKPGMFATVLVDTEKREDTLVVPAQSVVQRNQESYVFVVERTGEGGEETATVRKAVVATGLAQGGKVEILSGLEAGLEIVVKGVGLIDEDTLIDPVRGDAS
ncbi:efflux RND transporter periplasmic adaptor subunit [Anaerotalea alkaliphila]|uniref:Efflux RND transporter periplasmic adaptor subunit n=1 Tax=Anaerotalea alkaliphila TaxID=2662126 RepID=A0A7X5KN38_9FIRM|nr:efflux RND transporter periplasmic adaptor subunit [Anaerotalea alkaliphila]NDL66392.1 efflux RND transporter periplasmic adaptor subunit [Anaerotalea alkaliphila]